ncbi:hypothetical protein EYC84_003840 [Monilinia fructicola]|uniref:Uncharacterized protein n=1 Tax=Monilinia fructicola TaxID=38448 RepID=A0A5M9JXI5_MONFR|nr:hypothetical protein EYC84_003840 [Monilinia fructicola]
MLRLQRETLPFSLISYHHDAAGKDFQVVGHVWKRNAHEFKSGLAGARRFSWELMLRFWVLVKSYRKILMGKDLKPQIDVFYCPVWYVLWGYGTRNDSGKIES